MTPEEWRARGRKDFANGYPRAAAPSAKDTVPGREWRTGWDEGFAASETKSAETREQLAVRLELHDGRLVLTDGLGRIIGTQTACVIEQGETTFASVTFAGVEIKP